MAGFGIVLLRLSLGVVFLWFGALKFYPNVSPAQELATRTIHTLSGGLVPASVSLPFLAGWECLIGLGLLVGCGLRGILLLLYVQMLGTLTPIVLFPHEVFTRIPYVPRPHDNPVAFANVRALVEPLAHHTEALATEREDRSSA
jgi:uncharacterized membrane protein YphA (DoxX/SURF4 family)